MAEEKEWLQTAFQLCFLENEKNAEKSFAPIKRMSRLVCVIVAARRRPQK